jgi:excisionase family DNA binding protein
MGMLYTVDEVSERLGVPRPTLYRYLKEYAVPYERHAGRISIPEQSLERIRRVRELHDEGLGTAAVRRRLTEAEDSEMERIADRLDRLSEELEKSRSPEPIPSSQALNVVLARQTVLISAVYDLTRMVEQLLERDGRPRNSTFEYPENGSREDIPLSPTDQQPPEHAIDVREEPEIALPRERFGTLARRRRITIGIIAFVVAALALAWAALSFGLSF